MKYLALFLILISVTAEAAEYNCSVEQKYDHEKEYSSEYIKVAKFSVKVEDNGDNSFLSRCSFIERKNAVTCDRYPVDKIVVDERVKIKKYYVFRSQFDVQIFKNLSFVENNGRGGIAFGKCKLTAP